MHSNLKGLVDWNHRSEFALACQEQKEEVRWNETSAVLGILFDLTSHQVVFQDELFDDVICHQLAAVYDCITCYIWQTTWKDKFKQ